VAFSEMIGATSTCDRRPSSGFFTVLAAVMRTSP
jgi:hypothetical protein